MNKRFLILVVILLVPTVAMFFPQGQCDIWDPFHTKTEKITLWKTLWDAHPGTQYTSVGKTYSGEDIWLFTVGNPSGGRVLWDAELHGNEDKGGEILFLLSQWLLESGDAEAEKILQQNYLMFIPEVNTNDERGNGDTEISPYGVDLNRNFQNGWHQSNPDDDTYSGPYPLSEPETNVLRDVFSSYQPTFYVNLHCGAGPYAAYYNGTGSNATLCDEVIAKTNAICSEEGISPYRNRPMGSSGFAIGDATDLGVQSAWLIETVGVDTAWRHLPEHYDELVNVYYPKCRSLFIAMCDSCASTNSPTIDPPEIQSISQTPEPNNVFADNVVQIKVTVSYNAVGIKTVSLNYSLNGAENCTINMTQSAQNVWNCQIPPQPAGTAIAYSVTVENNAGNTTTSQSTSYTYSYIVTPEFPNAAMTILMLLSAATAVIMVQHRRKRQTAQ